MKRKEVFASGEETEEGVDLDGGGPKSSVVVVRGGERGVGEVDLALGGGEGEVSWEMIKGGQCWLLGRKMQSEWGKLWTTQTKQSKIKNAHIFFASLLDSEARLSVAKARRGKEIRGEKGLRVSRLGEDGSERGTKEEIRENSKSVGILCLSFGDKRGGVSLFFCWII